MGEERRERADGQEIGLGSQVNLVSEKRENVPTNEGIEAKMGRRVFLRKNYYCKVWKMEKERMIFPFLLLLLSSLLGYVCQKKEDSLRFGNLFCIRERIFARHQKYQE